MLSEIERNILAAFARIGCVSVQEALVLAYRNVDAGGIGLPSEEWQKACSSAEFQRALHSVFASLERALPPDPFAFPPRPPVRIAVADMQLAIDPYGPRYGGSPYDHVGRVFVVETGKPGIPMSAVRPEKVAWFDGGVNWKVIDREVAATVAAAAP